MLWLAVSSLVLLVLVPNTQGASDAIPWCYHLPSCNYTTWPTIAAPFCNGTRQSPININTATVTENPALTAFTFHNFSMASSFTKIENTGRTVKVTLAGGIGVSGGGLPQRYDSLQFHLHWGNGVSGLGSEHTVNGRQFPMELHIVHSKGSLNGNTTLAVGDSTGLAALGFFIEAMQGSAIESPASWKVLTDYLPRIRASGQSVMITHSLSLNDILGGVSLTNYYRYNGSLTTPACNEAVIWTVFNDTIKVTSDLINLFSTTLFLDSNATTLMHNTFRGVQTSLPVQMPARATTTSPSSAATAGYSLGLVALSLVLGRIKI